MTVSQTDLDALWDFSDAGASEKRLRAAVARASGADRAELETQVARALGLRGRYDEAAAMLDAISDDSPQARVRVALERGRIRNSSGDPDAAVPLFRDAAAAAAAAGLVFLRVDALHMLAMVDQEHADRWTVEALGVLDEVADARTLRWRVALHNNAGWRLFDAGRLTDALDEFVEAREAAQRWGTAQQVQWADDALAECRRALGER